MMGWDASGHPVTLTGVQCDAVLSLLDWDGDHPVNLPALGHGGGKSVVLATAARYDRARAAGAPFDVDPGR